MTSDTGKKAAKNSTEVPGRVYDTPSESEGDSEASTTGPLEVLYSQPPAFKSK